MAATSKPDIETRVPWQLRVLEGLLAIKKSPKAGTIIGPQHSAASGSFGTPAVTGAIGTGESRDAQGAGMPSAITTISTISPIDTSRALPANGTLAPPAAPADDATAEEAPVFLPRFQRTPSGSEWS